MMKMFVLIPRKAGVSRTYFHHHWATTHAELARRIPTLERYAQSHKEVALTSAVARPPFGAAPFLGVSEAWFASSEDALGMASSAEYRYGAMLDETNFMDMDRKARVFTSALSAAHGRPEERGDLPLKVVLFTAPREEPDGESLHRHWTGQHTELVLALPHVAGYRQRPVTSQTGDSSLPKWAFVDELWWRSADELLESWSSPEADELCRQAFPFVSDDSIALVAAEKRVIWSSNPVVCPKDFPDHMPPVEH